MDHGRWLGCNCPQNGALNVFSNFKKAYEPRPFDILDDKTNSFLFEL
jgi:hypothetical protein